MIQETQFVTTVSISYFPLEYDLVSACNVTGDQEQGMVMVVAIYQFFAPHLPFFQKIWILCVLTATISVHCWNGCDGGLCLCLCFLILSTYLNIIKHKPY
jgi:hypothetical protein